MLDSSEPSLTPDRRSDPVEAGGGCGHCSLDECAERAVASWERGDSGYEKVAAVFGIGSATLKRLVRRKRLTGSLEPEPPPNGFPPIISGPRLRSLALLVERNPDATTAELTVLLNARISVTVSRPAVVRALGRLGITRKKTLRAVEKDDDRVVSWTEAFDAHVATLSPDQLVFLDESGATIAMTRSHARGPRGQRVHDKVPRNRGTVLNMLGALSLSGLIAMATIDVGTSTDVFAAYVEQVLAPELKKGQVVIMDNLAAHRSPRIKALIEAVGASVLFLPPYSPERTQSSSSGAGSRPSSGGSGPGVETPLSRRSSNAWTRCRCGMPRVGSPRAAMVSEVDHRCEASGSPRSPPLLTTVSHAACAPTRPPTFTHSTLCSSACSPSPLARRVHFDALVGALDPQTVRRSAVSRYDLREVLHFTRQNPRLSLATSSAHSSYLASQD